MKIIIQFCRLCPWFVNRIVMVLFALVGGVSLARADYPIQAAALTQVKVTDGFWFDRLETNRVHTLKYCFDKCHETPRIANITNAAARVGAFDGIPFDDSDVFKVLEGAAYILAAHPDPELESYCDWLIGEIAKAQEPDGYLYTTRTLGSYYRKNIEPWHRQMIGPVRWSNVASGHELYNHGHLIEAACAWYQATGKRNFLEVAIKAANLIDHTFGPAPTQLKDAPGHEEIELALVKLYRVTNCERYLKLARHFIEMRGRGVKMVGDLPAGADGKPVANDQAPGYYSQAHIPVACQREAVGHAVRAGYLYAGMTDIVAIMGEKRYDEALRAIWQDVVGKKLHLNGGIGANPKHEAFGKPYELPNYAGESYMETCAAIANALWNERMFLATGEAKYIDVLERILYNGFLSGISLSGTEFFYPNPLTARGGCQRAKWFDCSCCPVNDVRFLPQVPSFAYATNAQGSLYWNLFMASKAKVGGWEFKVETDYPWSGKVKMSLLSTPTPTSTILIRIPGWALGKPVPSDLYRQTEPSSVMEVSVAVNGLAVNGVPGKDGYLAISRAWQANDTIELDLPMPVKRIRAHEQVVADRGCLAVERGPLVYCAEGFDNPGYKVRQAVLPAELSFYEIEIPFGDKKVVGLRAASGLKLIPYCLWDNRENGNEMQTWFKEKGPGAYGKVRPFGTTKFGEKANLYTLCGSGGLKMEVTDYGGKVNRLFVPNAQGELVDVTIGFDSPAGWEATDPYFGAIIGRVGNRISEGRFTLAGKEYKLDINDADHHAHLHGGERGWYSYVWDAQQFTQGDDVGIVFTHTFPDGEAGYPGTVKAKVTYTITPENIWRIEYEATTDQPTPLNLTHHVYFNLNGSETILDQELKIAATQYSPCDQNLKPVGPAKPVAGTPFDFREFHLIGERINASDEVLQFGPGYDHNWVLDGSGFRKVAEMKGKSRRLEVWTDQIGLQFYAGNFINNAWTMKDGRAMHRRSFLALETQHFPDSPNRPDFPSIILNPSETYRTVTEYRFLR